MTALARRHPGRLIALLGVLLVGTVLVSLALGRYPIGPADALELLASRVAPGFGDFSAQQETLFFNVRLPRILLVILVGASLSAAGAAFQGIFQNPLVSPTSSARRRARRSVRAGPSSRAAPRSRSPARPSPSRSPRWASCCW